MKHNFIKEIQPSLNLYQYNQIPVLELDHPVGKAKIALQGAQLLSWTPKNAEQDVIWLSEVEPFEAGNAIRGGIPICYPWFGAVGTPMHGYARIQLWELTDYDIQAEKVRLEFTLFSEDKQIIAKVTMQFDHELTLHFAGNEQNAQFAFHTYFNIGDISTIHVHNLPETCFNKLTDAQENVPSPRKINENVDCIYSLEQNLSYINDPSYQRQINIEHSNASDIVLWNPWHKSMPGMSSTAYQKMVCVETARIHQKLNDETVSVKISVK